MGNFENKISAALEINQGETPCFISSYRAPFFNLNKISDSFISEEKSVLTKSSTPPTLKSQMAAPKLLSYHLVLAFSH